MEHGNITINGDIIIHCEFDALADNEDFINALAEAICEASLRDEDDSEDTRSTERTTANTAIALIYPEGLKQVRVYDEYSHMIDGMDESCEFVVKDEPFNLVFERKGMITVDEANYLAVPAFALFHDDAMKPVSADLKLLKELEDFLENNRATVSFGKTDVEVIALEGHFCEGV